jgi:hypothetical protein
MLSAHPTTFSGYGTPYQLWFGKPEIESLGDRRYAVSVEGAGARISLAQELDRFLSALDEGDQPAVQPDHVTREQLIETYLQQYRAEIKRTVERYRRRLRKAIATDA